MTKAPQIMMTRPDFYEVSYSINPWMRPDEWARDVSAAGHRAHQQWSVLAGELQHAGMEIAIVPAQPGWPDMVFPANAAIALDRRVLLARFRFAERSGEEEHFRRFFEELKNRGSIDEILSLPEGILQEGAGDCIWDGFRQLFWAGYGQRSSRESIGAIAACFNKTVQGLELVTPRFYHLDTCFCALSHGEILYYPSAFSVEALAAIEETVPREQRIIATDDEATAFSLNAINIGRDLIMTQPPPRLAAILRERGYRCVPVDLDCYMMSGGAAYCMTLRLDLQSGHSR